MSDEDLNAKSPLQIEYEQTAREFEAKHNLNVDVAWSEENIKAYDKLYYGENLSYKEAKETADYLRKHPGAIVDFQATEREAGFDYVTDLMINKKMSKEDCEKFVSFDDLGEPHPKTEEAKNEIDRRVSDVIKGDLASADNEVTRYVIRAISNDPDISKEDKKSLMLQECNEYFSRIDSGTYDRTDYVDVNRADNKKYFLRSVIPYDKELAQQLAEEQGVSLYNSFSKRERKNVKDTAKTQRKVHDMQVKHVEEKAKKVPENEQIQARVEVHEAEKQQQDTAKTQTPVNQAVLNQATR